MALYLARVRHFQRDIWLFLVTAFLVGFTFDGGIYSVVFNLYLLRLGYDPEFIGQVNSAGLLAFAVTSLPAGLMGKQWGSRRMIIIGLSGMMAACALLPLVEALPVSLRPGWLYTCYSLLLLMLALYFVNAAPYMMAVAGAEQRDHVFSTQVALLAFSAFLGSLLGGFLPESVAGLAGISLDSPVPYRYPLILAAIFLAPAVLSMLVTRPVADFSPNEPIETDGPVTGKGAMRVDPFPLLLVGVLVLIRFFQVSGMAVAMIFFNVYMDAGLQVSTARIGVFSAVARLFGASAALVTPLVTARRGPIWVVVWGSVGVGLAMFPLALIPHWSAAGLGFIGAIAISSIRYPAFMVYTMGIISPRHRGTLAGAGEMAAGLSFAAMAFSGGYLITTSGYRNLFLLGAGLTLLGAVAFWGYFREKEVR